MTPSRSFLRATGVAATVAGVTTLAIVVLPQFYGPSRGLDAQLALHPNPLYQLRQWLSFLNIFAILLGSWGLAVHRMRDAPGTASAAMLFLMMYGAAELLGRSAMIFAREYRWIHALRETPVAERAELLTLVRGFDAVWSGWFVLILITFSLAAGLLGWATRGGSRLQQVTSWFLFAAAALGVVTLLAPYWSPLRPVAFWGYRMVQPWSRLLIGVFLLSEARRSPDFSAARSSPSDP